MLNICAYMSNTYLKIGILQAKFLSLLTIQPLPVAPFLLSVKDSFFLQIIWIYLRFLSLAIYNIIQDVLPGSVLGSA